MTTFNFVLSKYLYQHDLDFCKKNKRKVCLNVSHHLGYAWANIEQALSKVITLGFKYYTCHIHQFSQIGGQLFFCFLLLSKMLSYH